MSIAGAERGTNLVLLNRHNMEWRLTALSVFKPAPPLPLPLHDIYRPAAASAIPPQCSLPNLTIRTERLC